MSVATSKIRLYDLAKDLKIDTKRLIEEVRREGVDVSVPSNSISKELADKIRDKYFPKKDAGVKRAIRVVKKAARPVVEEPPVEAEEAAPPAEAIEAEEVAQPEEPMATPTTAPTRVIRKLAPAIRPERPAAAPPAATPVPQPAPEAKTVQTEMPRPAADARRPLPPSRQVRVLRPTAAAISAGIRPGERAPAPTPAVPTTRQRSRERFPRMEYAGTPGETTTPQTTYIPPPDTGRRRSRRGSTRGAKRTSDGKRAFDREFIPPPPTLTLEERIAGRMETHVEPDALKAVRLV